MMDWVDLMMGVVSVAAGILVGWAVCLMVEE